MNKNNKNNKKKQQKNRDDNKNADTKDITVHNNQSQPTGIFTDFSIVWYITHIQTDTHQLFSRIVYTKETHTETTDRHIYKKSKKRDTTDLGQPQLHYRYKILCARCVFHITQNTPRY